MPSEIPWGFSIVLGQSQVSHKAIMQYYRMHAFSGTLGNTEKHSECSTENLVSCKPHICMLSHYDSEVLDML